MTLALVAIHALLLTAPPAADTVPAGYELAWSDEFDRDGAPDSTNWRFERGFARNEEAQWYQPENARVSNGMLIIEGRRERVPNPTYDSTATDWRRSRRFAEYTSASMNTRGLHSWRYGRFEMRGKIDTRSGLWPAFWTLGTAGRWPANGEIDIMEYYRGMLLANVAWANASRGAVWDDSRLPIEQLGADWSSQFHVWRMDWDENEIRLYVDDRLLNTTDLRTTINGDEAQLNPLRQPHYILLNLAIGGMNGGDPSATAFPSRFEVDWVRVYRKKGE